MDAAGKCLSHDRVLQACISMCTIPAATASKACCSCVCACNMGTLACTFGASNYTGAHVICDGLQVRFIAGLPGGVPTKHTSTRSPWSCSHNASAELGCCQSASSAVCSTTMKRREPAALTCAANACSSQARRIWGIMCMTRHGEPAVQVLVQWACRHADTLTLMTTSAKDMRRHSKQHLG